MNERAARLTSFLIDGGWATDQPWYRAAIPRQHLGWTPPEERDFFHHIVALDPLPLQTHFYHWIDLARVANEPKSDSLRRRAPLFNIWQDRCEGMATAVEEYMLQAGLYDDLPRSPRAGLDHVGKSRCQRSCLAICSVKRNDPRGGWAIPCALDASKFVGSC